MRPRSAALGTAILLTLMTAAASARTLPPPFREQPVDPATRIDHDGRPTRQPEERDPAIWGHLLREAFVEQVTRAFDIPDKIIWALGPFGVEKSPEAANVNAYDEVPNSSWFTNRNHVRAVSEQRIREGVHGPKRPVPPYEIKSTKSSGVNPGFNIKDGAGNRWVVKLDRPEYPQISSGAGVVSSRLLWAAGYHISHDEAFTFRREELRIDDDLARGEDGAPPFGEEQLNKLLEGGARGTDGRYYASASLFLSGKIAGPFQFRGTRKDDPNDRFRHQSRRELRGLYVLYSWINNWDVKDHQSLDTFHAAEGESLGALRHSLLDVNASLGASGEGPKKLSRGYEQALDLGWTARRFFTLGFIDEPWRRARQESGIPSVGNFESEQFGPDEWRPSQYVEPFRKMTLADAYWGAKVVASFSDRQIAAAIDAAGYEDPRARTYLARVLRERRDKIARYWFERIAPLDFFDVADGALRFHDLAVDTRLERPRRYVLSAQGDEGPARVIEHHLGTQLPVSELDRLGSRVRLSIGIEGSRAKPVRVDLQRRGSDWTIVHVRHG